MSTTLSFTDYGAKILNVNPRKERHGDDLALAVDLKIEVSVSSHVLPALIENDDPDLFDQAPDADIEDHLFDEDGRPRIHGVKHIELEKKFEGYDAQINDLMLRDAKVNKFRVTPMGGRQVYLTLRIQSLIEEEQLSHLCNWIQESVFVRVGEGLPFDRDAADRQRDMMENETDPEEQEHGDDQGQNSAA